MNGVVIALAAACLVAGAAGIVARAMQRKKQNPTSADAAARSVSILALGHTQSGKTVLLASLWRELAFGGGKRVRVIAESEEDERRLQSLCDEIEDPGRERFPGSTLLGETKEWKFVVQALNRSGGPVDVFKFSYLDYAGEMIDRMTDGRELDPEFEHALHSADIVVGLLDGQKIARAMRGVADDDFSTTLRHLCHILSRREVKTLHIIITKWDLLAGRYQLDKVIEKLKDDQPFKDLLETPRLGGVRIIPVSGLGLSGFVYEDRSGVMKKVPGRGWHPAYVTAPLAATIPDVLATDVEALRERDAKKGRKPVVAVSEVSQVFFWITLVLGLAAPVNLTPVVIPTAVREIILKVSLNKILDKFGGIVDRSRGRAVPATLDDTSGLLRALNYLKGEIDRLENDIPAARLIPGAEMGQ